MVLDFDMQDWEAAAAGIWMEAEFGDILPQKGNIKWDSDQLSGMPSFHLC